MDRVLCCAQTRLKWQDARVTHLPFLSSDHSPLYIQLAPEVCQNARRRSFRFEAAWLEHPQFKELINTLWDRNISTREALKRLQGVLKHWNKEVFGDIQVKKEKLVQKLTGIQNRLDQYQTDDLLAEEEVVIKELDVVLEQEEMLWFQKSREKWVAFGDRNSKKFHMSTVIWRRRNRIESLQNDGGSWITNSKELEEHACAYFKRLYSLEDVDPILQRLPLVGFAALTQGEYTDLTKPFVAEEVEKSVRGMGSFKAPGPDGFQPIFYQKCWNVIGNSVTRFVLDFFETRNLPEETNDAVVVLIPKVPIPEKITQFRPISLCNVIFKTITKTMVDRLKGVMSKLIGPTQSSFIPGRLSTDNIVVVEEAVHSLRRKKCRKGWMVLKLDLEKAYDRVRWDFLEDTLCAVGLPEYWVRLIMQCVAGPSMSLLWNEEFKPHIGLRQGDPLSPYLFVMCMERLSHMIEQAIAVKSWKPISLSRGGPKLSHICFGLDSFRRSLGCASSSYPENIGEILCIIRAESEFGEVEDLFLTKCAKGYG